MSRHEEARIIEPAINVRLYNLIDIAANTADQPDVWIRKNRMEDVADASANDNADIVLCENLQSLPKGKIVKIEFLCLDYPIILKIKQQEPRARIKNRWNPRFKNGYRYSVHNGKHPIR